MKKIFLGLVVLGLLLNSAVCQIELLPLPSNPYQQYSKAKSGLRSADELRFLVDTLTLPFIDDFSTNKFKSYAGVSTDADVIDSGFVSFRVNGQAIDTLRYNEDTTYSFIKDPATGNVDTVPNDFISVTFFDEFDVDDIDTVWPAINYYFLGTQISQTVSITADEEVINLFDTICFKPDDGRQSLWLDLDSLQGDGQGVYLNNTFAINPPTQGVATFDGLDAGGNAYDLNNGTQGPADYLTSKPIDLSTYSVADVVTLTFFHQPQGNGWHLQARDSLIVEFYNPVENSWTTVFSAIHEPQRPFKQEWIVLDDQYLKRGFQFRFYNLSVLNGARSQWHIDYVYLDEGINGQTNFEDFSISPTDASFLTAGSFKYTAVPWKHFEANPANFPTQLDFTITNLDAVQAPVDRYHSIREILEDTVIRDTAFKNFQPSFPANSSQSFDFEDPLFQNLTTDTKRKIFEVTAVASSGGLDIIPENDTTVKLQEFSTYYAYDDGTAERVISMPAADQQLAVQFNTSVADTIQGLRIYFPPYRDDISELSFRIKIWSSLEPENTIYEDLTNLPQYSGIDEYVYYELAEPVRVSGTYYIGYQQVKNGHLYVGFDMNTNSRDKLFYYDSANEDWLPSNFDGSAMIRPDFGEEFKIASVEEESIISAQTVAGSLYPNPANGYLNLRVLDNTLETHYSILDLSGKQLLFGSFYGSNRLDLGAFQQGIYLVKLQQEGKSDLVKKLVVRR